MLKVSCISSEDAVAPKEMERRIVWIGGGDAPEQMQCRLLAGLRELAVKLVTVTFRMAAQFPFRNEDLVILEEGSTAQAGFEQFARKTAQRCSVLIWSSEQSAALLNCGVQFLDVNEGAGIARARILKALGEPREPLIMAKAQVPEWRRTLIGESRGIQKVAEIIRLVGPRRCTVLITGETGTGKEVVARAIHLAGPRAQASFVALNCGAVPGPLLEAELFGHTRGAFTGASQSRVGRIEQAESGTLFLDEIGDLPLELQAKLLRVLQEREFQRLGSSETHKMNARVIAATNCDLKTKVARGEFRADLYYRLNVVPLELPPLRTRISDVRPLAQHFIEKVCDEERIDRKNLAPGAWALLESYDWPGNVRQLENSVCSAVILSGSQPFIDECDFGLLSGPRLMDRREERESVELPEHGLSFAETVNALERDLLSQALKRTGGNKKAAAEMLQMKRTTLSARVRVLDVDQGAA